LTALLLIAVFVLVLVNAFFVIAEYSLVRSRRPKLEAAKDEGLRGAALALDQLDNINEYISACQVGITLTSIGIGAVGELVPKLYAIEHADRLVRLVARPLRVSRLVFAPFISGLTFISNRILRLLGVDPDTINEQAENPEELKLIITESLQGGQLDPGEAGMLRGVFHLHEQEARQVMTPIPAVVTVDVSVDVKTALERCITTGHTRLLVIEEDNPDRVRGIVHASRLARALMEAGEHAPIDPLVRDAPIVPETKPLDDLLAELQRERTEMAVVVDEYGRVAGIITLEDIIEEVVGEIEDETDPAGGAVRRLANGDWYVRGEVAITDLVDYGLELPVDTDAYNSVGGFVFAALGRLPRRGDTITANGYSIRVESVRENRIEAVRIRQRTPA
jgi:CBS domain containing-hemolysin-like protein